VATDADRESKTEEATETRVREERDKGNVPHSAEVGVAASLVGATAVALFAAGSAGVAIIHMLQPLVDRPGDWSLRGAEDAAVLLSAISQAVSTIIAGPIAVLFVAGLAGAFVQGVPRIAWRRVAPDMSRISIAAGFRRLFGVQGWSQLRRAVAKLAILCLVARMFIATSTPDLLALQHSPTQGAPAALAWMVAQLLGTLAALAVALAVADMAWSRRSWRRRLRMSRQEVRDEHRNMDGDPLLKARMRTVARQRTRRRMMASVPRATLVIANPTHYAVALRYVREEGGAPVVLAKGRDLVALRIREIAERNGVAVIEDKALARSLYDSVEIDQMIPPAFYKVIAEVIIFLNKRRPRAGEVAR